MADRLRNPGSSQRESHYWILAGSALALTVFGCGSEQGSSKGGSGATGGSSSAGAPNGGSADVGNEGGSGRTIPPVVEKECVHPGGEDAPPYLQEIGCARDFELLASEPLDASIPGARSAKVVLDTRNGDQLYYQNTDLYPIHWEFASAELSTTEDPVADLSTFNTTEYFSPDRRFVLAAVTHYEGPDVWALEFAPYDRATTAMIEQLYATVAASSYFGPALRFHAQTAYLQTQAETLPDDVFTVTTDEIFSGIDYQPLNLGQAMGTLRFMTAEQLETDYVSFSEIVVLDRVPNDIAVVAGLITEEFQTPLSHVNVLSQNRGTPNMGLRSATTNEELRALEGQWVHLTVGANDYAIEEVDAETAQAFIEGRKPDAAVVTPYDTSVTGLLDIETIVVPEEGQHLRDAIREVIPYVGGKAAHYSWLAQIDGILVQDAFAIPAHYYDQFLQENGFDERLDELFANPDFLTDSSVRDAELAALRTDMMSGEVNDELQELLRTKLAEDFPDEPRIRFRSSTNAEDLEGFTGAGLYTSKTGVVEDWNDVLDAIREVWSSVWYYRAFDEREYRSIDHRDVAMCLLVTPSFPEEEANGVAITNNIFDTAGLNPAFYVNVQVGDASVVEPDPGVTTDELVYYYDAPNKPIVYLSESNQVESGTHVLTAAQVNELGKALSAIHRAFSPAYGPASGLNDRGWYAMDTEFKFDDRGTGEVRLYMKQARPYPGRGQDN